MKTLSIAIVVAAALLAYGLHSLGQGIADSNRKKEISVNHKILFDTDDPFPREFDIDLGIQGQGNPALHLKVD